MSQQAIKQHIDKANKLIEQARFMYGTAEFFSTFIDHWAYQQSGLYPPAKDLPNELLPVAKELSHLLSEAMRIAPDQDVFAIILGELGAHKRGGNYFPTPSHISQLMAALIEAPNGPEQYNFYEPCVGTGSMVLNWLEQKYINGGKEALSHVTLHLEDLDTLMVKCTFIQVLNFLANKEAAVKSFRIEKKNTLTQEEYGLVYFATAAENEQEQVKEHDVQHECSA